MRRAVLALILLAAAAPGAAAERSYTIGSFDRVRVSGPFEVRLTVGGSPRARAEGERELIAQVEVRVDGNTLVRSEEHTSVLPSIMRISFAVFCLKKDSIQVMYIHIRS